jgi:hypothetical protein
LLLGTLLLAAFVQVGLARPKAVPEGAIVNTIAVSAADCYPNSDDREFINTGAYIQGTALPGFAYFICPVHFPDYGTHTVRSVTIYVYDNYVSDDVLVDVYRTNPSAASRVRMGTVESTGSSATKPRAFTIRGSAIRNRSVSPTRVMFLSVLLYHDTRFYGARIKYIGP